MTENNNRPPEPPAGFEPSAPNDPNNTPMPQPSADDMRDLKKSQTLVMVASIAGPVSLFIGGMLLSAAGFICGIIGFRKLGKLTTKQTDVAKMAQRLKRSSIVGIVVCGVAFALNAVAFYLMLPVVLDMVESGNYAGSLADIGAGSTGLNSTWG